MSNAAHPIATNIAHFVPNNLGKKAVDHALLAKLRADIGAITPHEHEGQPRYVPTGVANFDAALGGGIAIGGISQAMPPENGALDVASTFHFTLSLASRLLSQRMGDLVLVLDHGMVRQWGMVQLAGLEALNIDPARLLIVRAKGGDEAHWAIEEAAASAGIAAVLGWLSGRGQEETAKSVVAARRITLAAASAHNPVILASDIHAGSVFAAHARMVIAPFFARGQAKSWHKTQPSSGYFASGYFSSGYFASGRFALPSPGNPAWKIDLLRSRSGGHGSFHMEYDYACHRLCACAPLGVGTGIGAIESGEPTPSPSPKPTPKPAPNSSMGDDWPGSWHRAPISA